ncbi:hypothetical protein ACTHPF_26750 [Paenibacillus sp. SAF-054]|uniref:hypothetical protein n=1 Tax=unclassified Paenibacillus TaxID=185978 RepID=UPI003F808467
MRKGHPFLLEIPMTRAAKLEVRKVWEIPGIDPFTVHSIDSIEIDGTKATIIGYVAKEESSEKR